MMSLGENMELHSSELCEGAKHRLFHCVYKDSQWFSEFLVRETCFLKCLEEKGPVSEAP